MYIVYILFGNKIYTVFRTKCSDLFTQKCSAGVIECIGLYTPINYFGRYATCSHKDGGRSRIQSRETIGQEDHVTCLKLRRRVNSSPAFGATYKTRIFYKYVVFKHPCSLFYQISSQQQHTPFSVNQQERKATPWMGLADIHIQWLWDAFQSLRNCPFLIIKKGHFKLVILL